MKKGDTSRIKEIFYKLSLDTKFEGLVREARKSANIPQDGFDTKEQSEIWFIKNLDKQEELFYDVIFILNQYKFPFSYFAAIVDYITYRKLPDGEDKGIIIVPAGADLNAEEVFKAIGHPFVKVYILGTRSKTDTVNSIRDNWGEIEKNLKIQGDYKKKRIRKTIFKDRRKEIDKLWNEVKDKKMKNKELYIAKKMKQLGHGDISSGYIRSLYKKK